ncbi:hypothetical protein ASPWEDRAFT_36189 [Aspergillus wentii DTO 134E9]|uniref:Uncharacterized protein n=1 Tax=Aspergillus wentii DTO 134E9 TaxID=1073089 RepID=A0A1L9RUK6_ASPWE|nr:uncharacterized protein ASPWEDRAFT_36189 [Aspergillus wentii DTO 134E9]OJJ38537.1 hypothetical protein ASPWEDRAFT_36189 [Aspergillus wentii DTO 134E9]
MAHAPWIIGFGRQWCIAGPALWYQYAWATTMRLRYAAGIHSILTTPEVVTQMTTSRESLLARPQHSPWDLWRFILVFRERIGIYCLKP